MKTRLLFLLLILTAFCSQATLVTFTFTNSQTGLLDTNDFKIVPLGNTRNSDGSFINRGLPIRVHNPYGTTNIWLTGPQYYQATNEFIGNTIYIRTIDASSNLVAAGNPSIFLGSANPFVELAITLSGAATNAPRVTSSNASLTVSQSLLPNGATNYDMAVLSSPFASIAGNLTTIGTNNINTNNASQLTSGTVSLSRLPAFMLTNGQSFIYFNGNGLTVTDADGSVLGITGASWYDIYTNASAIDPIKVILAPNGAQIFDVSPLGTVTAGSNVVAGALGSFYGNASGLTNVPATSLTGTILQSVLPPTVVSNNNSGASWQAVAGTNQFLGSGVFSNNVIVSNNLAVLGRNCSVALVGFTNGTINAATATFQNGFGTINVGFTGLTTIDTLYSDSTYGLFGIGYAGLGGGFAGKNANIVVHYADNGAGSTNDIADFYSTNGATASPVAGVTSNGIAFAQNVPLASLSPASLVTSNQAALIAASTAGNAVGLTRSLVITSNLTLTATKGADGNTNYTLGGLTFNQLSALFGAGVVTNATIGTLTLVNPLNFTNISSGNSAAGTAAQADGRGNTIFGILNTTNVAGQYQITSQQAGTNFVITNTVTGGDLTLIADTNGPFGFNTPLDLCLDTGIPNFAGTTGFTNQALYGSVALLGYATNGSWAEDYGAATGSGSHAVGKDATASGARSFAFAKTANGIASATGSIVLTTAANITNSGVNVMDFGAAGGFNFYTTVPGTLNNPTLTIKSTGIFGDFTQATNQNTALSTLGPSSLVNSNQAAQIAAATSGGGGGVATLIPRQGQFASSGEIYGTTNLAVSCPITDGGLNRIMNTNTISFDTPGVLGNMTIMAGPNGNTLSNFWEKISDAGTGNGIVSGTNVSWLAWTNSTPGGTAFKVAQTIGTYLGNGTYFATNYSGSSLFISPFCACGFTHSNNVTGAGSSQFDEWWFTEQ